MPTEDDLPTLKLAKTKVKVRGHLVAPWGTTYDVQRPNALVANAVMAGPDGNMNLAYMNDFIEGHIVASQRADFREKIMAEEGLDAEALLLMMEKLNEIAYADLPSEP